MTTPELHMKPPRADNRKNVTKAANACTQRFFGLLIKRYIVAVKAGTEPKGIPLSD